MFDIGFNAVDDWLYQMVLTWNFVKYRQIWYIEGGDSES